MVSRGSGYTTATGRLRQWLLQPKGSASLTCTRSSIRRSSRRLSRPFRLLRLSRDPIGSIRMSTRRNEFPVTHDFSDLLSTGYHSLVHPRVMIGGPKVHDCLRSQLSEDSPVCLLL